MLPALAIYEVSYRPPAPSRNRLALRARTPGPDSFFGLPSVAQAFEHLQHFRTAQAANDAMMTLWVQISNRNYPLMNAKADLVQDSMTWFFRSVCLLILPLVWSAARLIVLHRNDPAAHPLPG